MEQQPKPPIFALAVCPEDVAAAPDPAVFNTTNISPLRTRDHEPSVSQVAAHLLLMAAMQKWRSDLVSGSRGKALIGISYDGHPDSNNVEPARQERMLIGSVVEMSVPRFEAWWFEVSARLPIDKQMELPDTLLPPMDVMLVWHSYLLNPQLYADDCVRLGAGNMLNIAFPWKTICDVVDLHTLSYRPSCAAVEFFENLTGRQFDLVDDILSGDPSTKYTLTCPSCSQVTTVPIIDSVQVEDLTTGFELTCSCGFSPAVEDLRQEIIQFMRNGKACRGLNWKATNIQTHFHSVIHRTFPSPDLLPTSNTSLNHLKTTLREATTTPSEKRAIEHVLSFYVVKPPTTRAAVSHYSAVLRDLRFVDTMHKYMWLRSPTLYRPGPPPTGTLPRARVKYRKFVQLSRLRPDVEIAPTLDLDLVWHTHVLSPVVYHDYCLENAGSVIGHDDKVSEDFREKTSKTSRDVYQEVFGGEYDGCFCVPCEIERDYRDLEREKLPDGEWRRRVEAFFWQEVERRREAQEVGYSLQSLYDVLEKGPVY